MHTPAIHLHSTTDNVTRCGYFVPHAQQYTFKKTKVTCLHYKALMESQGKKRRVVTFKPGLSAL